MTRRIIAFFIDHIVICIGIGVVAAFNLLLFQDLNFNTLQTLVFSYSVIIWYIYMIFRDSLFTRSIGKRVMGLKISYTNSEAQNPSKISLIKRNIPLLIFPIEAIILILSKNKRRIGDIWAKCNVIISK